MICKKDIFKKKSEARLIESHLLIIFFSSSSSEHHFEMD